MKLILTAANIDKLLSHYSFVDGAKTQGAERRLGTSTWRRKEFYLREYTWDDMFFQLFIHKEDGHVVIKRQGHMPEKDYEKLPLIKEMINDGMLELRAEYS